MPQFKAVKIPNSSIFPPQLRDKTVQMAVDTLEFLPNSQVRLFLKYSPNPFNVRLACTPSGGYPPWCYDDYKLTQFFNDPTIKAWLGNGRIPQKTTWEFASFQVAHSLSGLNPPIYPLESYYAEALRNNINVIFVYGKN